MTIPPDPTAGNTATPSCTTSPSQRPQAGTERDGTPITSAPAALCRDPRRVQLVSRWWTDVLAATLLDHLGREALRASVDRYSSKAWRKDTTTGESTPRFYTVGSPALTRCQYAVMTHPQRSAVLIID